MAHDNQNQRIAKGQAYNLAIETAIADGKQHDNEYIVKQFLRHLQFSQLLQKADAQGLADALKSAKVRDLITELDKELSGGV